MKKLKWFFSKLNELLDNVQDAVHELMDMIFWLIVILTIAIGLVWVGVNLFQFNKIDSQQLSDNLQLFIGVIATGVGFSLLSFEYARLLKEQKHRNKRIAAEKAALNFFSSTIMFLVGSIVSIAAVGLLKTELEPINPFLNLLAIFLFFISGLAMARGLQQIWKILNPTDTK